MRGMYVVLEGLDGMGKTRLCGELPRILEQDGGQWFVMKEPSDPNIKKRWEEGGGTDGLELATLFDNDRIAQSVEIMSLLEDGKNILQDRNWLSTCAYQGAQVGHGWKWAKRKGMAYKDHFLGVDKTIVLLPHVDLLALKQDWLSQTIPLMDRRGCSGRELDGIYERAFIYRMLAGTFKFPVVDAAQDFDIVLSEVLRHILAP